HAAPSRLNLFFESSKSKVNSWKANINQRLIQLKGAIKAITAQPLKLSSRKAQRQEPKKIIVSRQQSAKNKPAQKIKTPGKIKKKALRKKKPIASAKFIGKQEHSCPYCLEVVESNDPRGVKVCSICQTHHHADCWGITGTCQIPHALD
ncbi:MAG: hypothetical protein N2C13_01395, partial [Chloroflexota bacterium]